MGTYTDFSVAGYSVLSTKSDVVPEAMTVFRETDRREYKRHVITQRRLDLTDLADVESDDVWDVVEYTCAIKNAIDRLHVMGFTLKRIRQEFERGRESELAKYRSWSDSEEASATWAPKIQFLASMTFDHYLGGLRDVISNRLYAYTTQGEPLRDTDPMLEHILRNDDYEFGFFAHDIRCVIRAICEVAPSAGYVVQDVSELISAGYYELDAKICDEAIQALVAGHPENSKQIILTEGSTDASVLRRALDLLHPHLSGYYSFLDFDLSKSPGGAGHLVSLVKAFAATGITNRVVALFDNDTAAQDARRALAQVSLPRNVIVRSYPDLQVLRSYPTLGPSGQINLDVNGLAASIELYLGVDVLLSADGGLVPVQWRGYNETVGKYQGEVMRKAQLMLAFDKKVDKARQNPQSLAEGDWSGLLAILSEVFNAFDEPA
jgi:HEPN/Toprim N-terminal domain 1